MKKPRGYWYVIGYWHPGDEPGWDQFKRLDYRDNLEDAEKILMVLFETDISFTAYGIILEPVWEKEEIVSNTQGPE